MQMFQSFFRFNWRKSQAHLLLLSKFLRPHTVEDYENLSVLPWKQVLSENPKKAINRFLDEGVLKQANIAQNIERKYKISDLKKMLKERNLTTSGNKGDLILRLIEKDPAGMKEIVSGMNALICSEQGRLIVDEYLAIEKEESQKLNQQVMDALKRHNFKKASFLASSYNAEQVFTVGLGFDWRDPKVFDILTENNI
jgi:hypothetical protein